MVLEAKRLNLTIEEASKAFKLTPTAIRCAASRNNIKLRSISGRPKHGLVKEAVLLAMETNPPPTITELCRKYKIKRTSVLRTLCDFKFKLKP